MAELFDKITRDLAVALKAKDGVVVSTLRFLISNLHNAEIAKGKELTDEEVLGEIAKGVKRHKESIEAFEQAGRNELVAKEKGELEVVSRYLPVQFSGEEVGKIVDEVIAGVGATSVADMGKVMGEVMARVRGKASGSIVSAIVKKKLGG